MHVRRWSLCKYSSELRGLCRKVPQQPALPSRQLHPTVSQQQQQQHAGSTAPGGVFRKETVSQVMEDRLYNYLLQHTREPEVLAQLRADTNAQFPTGARMLIGPEQGAFMRWLVSTLQAKNIIEVGVFTGYSSIAMALALPPDGKLVACDRDPRPLALAKQYWEKAGVAEKIECLEGPASESLDALLAAGRAGTFDFAFVDADKRGYRAYHEQLLQLVRPGGVLVYDNVLWRGQVAEEGPAADKNTAAMRELNAFLLGDARVEFSLLPVGDGVALCTRR